MKNVMLGYLTEECAACPDWKNNKDAVGCSCHFPIAECPYFAKMYNEREKENCIKF